MGQSSGKKRSKLISILWITVAMLAEAGVSDVMVAAPASVRSVPDGKLGLPYL